MTTEAAGSAQASETAGAEAGEGRSCKACRHCFMEPSDMNFVCGHPDAGPVGVYIHGARAAGRGHCGPSAPKFEQHPLRTPNGDLKP